MLGYFSNRTVINLDGLVNSKTYYEEVLQKPDQANAIKHYLYLNNATYIVDHSKNEVTKELQTEQTFPVPTEAGRAIYIWRVQPFLAKQRYIPTQELPDAPDYCY
jgi:hypothetical protein